VICFPAWIVGFNRFFSFLFLPFFLFCPPEQNDVIFLCLEVLLSNSGGVLVSIVCLFLSLERMRA
jgi:hypothetical protein